jgi:hypothetical protein
MRFVFCYTNVHSLTYRHYIPSTEVPVLQMVFCQKIEKSFARKSFYKLVLFSYGAIAD